MEFYSIILCTHVFILNVFWLQFVKILKAVCDNAPFADIVKPVLSGAFFSHCVAHKP